MLKNREMRLPTIDSEIHSTLTLNIDYFRYFTIGLAIQRVLYENIQGSLAEVGIYRGDMSKFIHKIAPNQCYYLFDTFEGFPQKDFDLQNTEDNRFNDTSVDIVLKNIADTNIIIIKKGYVPEKFQGLENEKFTFVLLDVDLYKPTYRSLLFFYP